MEPPGDRIPASRLVTHQLRWYHAGRWIVDCVDLTVERGEIVGLLGPNGAGKTVTLSMIAGLLEPTAGRVRIGATDVTSLPLYRRARLGSATCRRSDRSSQNFRRETTCSRSYRHVTSRTARRRADELLARFGLSHVAASRAARLSGGEQRRLEVARSLATDPSFLLFDEPFAGIDPLTIESLHAILLELRKTGVGILITDHNVRETLSLCDRAYILFRGRVLAQGTPATLIGDPAVRRHFLGDSFEMGPDEQDPFTHEAAGSAPEPAAR